MLLNYMLNLFILSTYLFILKSVFASYKLNIYFIFVLRVFYVIFPFSDTAAVYHNEKYIKEALQVLLPKYHLKREDLFITSKLGIHFHNNIKSNA